MRDDTWQRIQAPAEGEATTFPMATTVQLSTGPVEISEEGFVVRFDGKLHAWLNHCPHTGSPLDWKPGQFFSEDGQHLICFTHHALFDPASGACLDGPCPRGLYPLEVRDCGDYLEVPTRHGGTADE